MQRRSTAKQKSGTDKEREIRDFSERKREKPIGSERWKRVRVSVMDLQHRRDGANGDDDTVERNRSPSQSHMQTAVAFRHEAALQEEENHPAGHESAVKINEGGNLLRYRLSGIVQAVHVKHAKADGHARDHHQAGDQVEESLSTFACSSVWTTNVILTSFLQVLMARL